MIKAVILDFDGIILESVDVKGQVFLEVFKNYPEHAQAILDYHYANGGVSRFEKFRHIHQHILKVPLPESTFNDLCKRFADLVVEQVLKVDFVPGAREFLKNHYRTLDLFIVSATPDEEIKAIVRAKGLDHFFKGVHGSPQNKSAWTWVILNQGPYRPDEVFWVGDALSDWQAAQDHGIKFLGRVTDRNIFEDRPMQGKFQSLDEIAQYVEE